MLRLLNSCVIQACCVLHLIPHLTQVYQTHVWNSEKMSHGLESGCTMTPTHYSAPAAYRIHELEGGGVEQASLLRVRYHI